MARKNKSKSKTRTTPKQKPLKLTTEEKELAETELFIKSKTDLHRITERSSLGKTSIICLCIVISVLAFCYMLIKVQGTETTISLGASVMSNINIRDIGSLITIISLILFTRRQRKLRLLERGQFNKRIVPLEQTIDPERTTSGVTVSGDSNTDGKKEPL